VSTSPEYRPEGGSFRDRNSRVYVVDGRIVRGLSRKALEAFDALTATAFYQRAVSDGHVVPTWKMAPEDVPLNEHARGQWEGFLEHERIQPVTYAYEWTFSMLKAAAGLTLDLLESALEEDFTLKDATPYNIQFRHGQPVLIDIPSFEHLRPGSPWVGYRQFCEMFLFPLMLHSYRGLDFQPLLRAGIDGIDVQQASRMLHGRDRFRRGVMSHVWLQSKLVARHGGTERKVGQDLEKAGFNKALIQANVRRLRKLVSRLEGSDDITEWGNYAEMHNYSAEDHQRKEAFVEACLAKAKPGMTWDVGSNDGQFSRIAARHSQQVLALDVDHSSLERLYCQEDRPDNILPLLHNVLDPSPNWGWRLRERRDLPHRAPPDLLLCLAVIHHVVITGHVPLDDFVDWLAEITPAVVIEFVDRSDDRVQALLRNKADEYEDYDHDAFRLSLQRYFTIESKLTLDSGRRHLFYARQPDRS